MPRPCTDEENKIANALAETLDQFLLDEAEYAQKFQELLFAKTGSQCCVRLVAGSDDEYEVFEEGE